MKKLYTILTSLIVFILIVHVIYMILSVTNVVDTNEDFAQNLGYTLMYASIIHGIYGLVKWICAIVNQKKMDAITQTGKTGHQKLSHAARTTKIQRILGLLIIAIVIPHGSIKVLSAQPVILIVDICYMIALMIHVWIGFPKWIVSLGLRPANKNKM